MVSDRFRLRYRLKPEHYLDYRILSLRRMQKGRSWKRLLVVLLIGVLLGLSLLALENTGYVSDRDVMAGFIGGLLAVTVMFAATFVKTVDAARSMVGVHNALVGEFSLTAYDGGGIQITGKHITSSYEWSAFVEMTNAADLLILWVDRGAGVIVPTSTFASDEERQTFVDYASERIKAHQQGQ